MTRPMTKDEQRMLFTRQRSRHVFAHRIRSAILFFGGCCAVTLLLLAAADAVSLAVAHLAWGMK